MSNKKSPGANRARAEIARAALITTNCLQYTTICEPLQVANLLDLAQYEADQALEQYRQAEAVANIRRRRYFKAIDNLRALQRGIFFTGGRG